MLQLISFTLQMRLTSRFALLPAGEFLWKSFRQGVFRGAGADGEVAGCRSNSELGAAYCGDAGTVVADAETAIEGDFGV